MDLQERFTLDCLSEKLAKIENRTDISIDKMSAFYDTLPADINDLKRRGRDGGDSFTCEGTAVPSCPPITNRGVSKYRNIKDFTSFDGGAEIGLDGFWNQEDFELLKERLEREKEIASDQPKGEHVLELGSRFVTIRASGANGGVYYRYQFISAGVTVLIRDVNEAHIQPIRLHFGYNSLRENDLKTAFYQIADYLLELGFVITKETISRVDLQTTLTIDPKKVFKKVLNDSKRVCRCRKFKVVYRNDLIESITSGQNLQICVYDKAKELLIKRDEQKINDIIDYFGEDPDYLTRIEFRLRRDFLRDIKIDTIDDLYFNLGGIIEYLTYNWFRLVKDNKVRGHEQHQELDPLWLLVRERLFDYFGNPESEINRKNFSKATAQQLIDQALGCLAAAYAKTNETGELGAGFIADYAKSVIDANIKSFVAKAREKLKIHISTTSLRTIEYDPFQEYSRMSEVRNEFYQQGDRIICRTIYSRNGEDYAQALTEVDESEYETMSSEPLEKEVEEYDDF